MASAATNNLLQTGLPFLITDQDRIGIATGVNTYEVFAKLSEVAPVSHVGSGGPSHAEATVSEAGFMSAADKAKLNGLPSSAQNAIPYISDTPPNPSQEKHWFDLSGRHFLWDGDAWHQVGGIAAETGASGSGVPTYVQTTDPLAPSPYIWFQTDELGNVIDILKG